MAAGHAGDVEFIHPFLLSIDAHIGLKIPTWEGQGASSARLFALKACGDQVLYALTPSRKALRQLLQQFNDDPVWPLADIARPAVLTANCR